MRVLLDENLPRRLKRSFAEGVEVLTVQDCGWKGLQNGELLRVAQIEFDVFVTTDRGIPFEQNLSSLLIAIVILESWSNRLDDLAVTFAAIKRSDTIAQPWRISTHLTLSISYRANPKGNFGKIRAVKLFDRLIAYILYFHRRLFSIQTVFTCVMLTLRVFTSAITQNFTHFFSLNSLWI